MLARRTRLKSRSKKAAKRQRNLPYLGWIRTLPCALCAAEQWRTVTIGRISRRYAVEAAHTNALGDPGFGGAKSPDESAIPLCGWCHRDAPDSYHRWTPERRWAERHELDVGELVARLNRVWRLVNGGTAE